VENIHSVDAKGVGDGTYVGFLVLMLLGAFLAWGLLNVQKIVRKDGSRVIAVQHPSWKTEFLGLWEVLRSEPWIVGLFPMFLAANWFYSYQFNDVNFALFNVRTRSLNGLLYWLSQIFGALFMGFALDTKLFSRKMRARLGLIVVFVFTCAVWGGGLALQLTYTRASVAFNETKGIPKMDWTSSGYGSRCVLYICYGLFDAVWQTYLYWLMGALSNNSRKLAIYAGFYKSIQSAGSAIIYRLDALEKPYIALFGSTWGLLLGSLLIAAPVVFLQVKDHTEVAKDLEFTDETTAATEKFEQST